MLKTNQIIILIVGFILGIFVTISIKKFTFFSINNSISLEINPIELISICINVLIAYYLTVVFGKKNDVDKSEKDLLIRYFEDFKKDKDLIISDSTNLILSNSRNDNLINSQLKYLRQKLNMNLKLLVDRNFLTENHIYKQNAEAKMRNIWEKITYTPNTFQQNFSIENELYNARTLSTELDRLLFDIIILINDKK